ncbi:MAG: methyltransferase domain-containing protein [Candidatus Parcubacteria bacterium]|nr:methyltransferase domain-containing protein [Candidatus Parcubacteria bacterium]
MENNEAVKKYWNFEETAEEFDEIYDNKGGIFKRFINKIFRKGMRERVTMTLKECDSGNKTVLDIGCGSGRVALLLAEKGMKVTGIDYSLKMIELADEHLRKYKAGAKTELNVEFMRRDFMRDFGSNELFDITLALGVFDYVEGPMPLLERMKNLTKEKIIASYPAKFTFQMPIRKIWLWIRNCPVYFYTKSKLKKMYVSMGITNYKIRKTSAGYLVIANLLP